MRSVSISPEEVKVIKQQLKNAHLFASDASILIKRNPNYLSNSFSRGEMEERSYLDLMKLLKKNTDEKQLDASRRNEERININSEALRKIIKDKRISATKITQELGWGRSTISNALMRGKMIKEDVEKLAEYLGVSPDDLIVDKDEDEKSLSDNNEQEKDDSIINLQKVINDFIDDEMNLLSSLETSIKILEGR